MKRVAFLILLCCSAAIASGAEHGSGKEGEIPFEQIGWQAANLGILLIVLFFYIKKPIIEIFRARREEYISRAEKTMSALRDAEASLAGAKEKLSTLESGEEKSLQAAQLEAKVLGANLIKDAETAAQKIKKDATQTINNELLKAKAEINAAILNQAIIITTKALKEKNQMGASAEEAMFVKQLEQVKA